MPWLQWLTRDDDIKKAMPFRLLESVANFDSAKAPVGAEIIIQT